MDLPEDILRCFSAEAAQTLRAWSPPGLMAPEELRCRVGQPVLVQEKGRGFPAPMAPLAAKELDEILERAVKASFYAHSEEFRRGYLHTSSGCRIGLCGTILARDGQITGIRDLTSLCIRIPHALCGCADAVLPALQREGFSNTLLLSPPGAGKTTLLRDLIRQLSDGGLRVAVADERGEIGAVHGRMPSFDLGKNTDIMFGGRKGESAMMLLRTMSPEVLAFDEITSPEDLAVIHQAAGCGVSLLATAHASDMAALNQRRIYRELLAEGIFEQAVWIRVEKGARRYTVESLWK